LATVLANMQVVFVGLVAWVRYQEQPTRLALVLLPLVFLGVALMSGAGRPDAYGADPIGGVIFGLFSGAAYASFLLVFRASSAPSRQTTAAAPYPLPSGQKPELPIAPVLDVTLGVTIGALLTGLFDAGFSVGVPYQALLWLIALALVAQVIGWLLISVALPRLPALETSVILLLQPLATTLWAWLLFDERLSLVQWAGVGLVLSGVAALVARGTVKRPSHATVATEETGEETSPVS
jgi:drug/metabolite transporter (DMT)-like permease